MSNWDLMMPGMGLTALGLAGVTISYAGIAHTFIDGMHALTGLLMMFGLIILSAGILDGGVSTSNRAKATTLVILSIALAFGAYAVAMNTISTTTTFAGIMMIIVIPSIMIAYIAMKHPKYLKPVGSIFALAAIAGISAYVVFGLVGPDPYMIPKVEEVVEEVTTSEITGPIYTINILLDSAVQGNPDYEPDEARVQQGYVIEWVNQDTVAHTSTSSADFGETFDTGMISGGESFRLDTSEIAPGEYEYMCVVHPWMSSVLIIEESREPVVTEVSIPKGAGIQKPGQIYYDPSVIQIATGTTIKWVNNDETIHTVTSGTPEEGPSGLFDSDLVSAGESFEYTFTNPGREDYYCIVHPWMVGSVDVE